MATLRRAAKGSPPFCSVWLIERVEILQKLVREVCEERLNADA